MGTVLTELLPEMNSFMTSALTLSLANGYTPAVGTVLNLITGREVHGRFSGMTVYGRSVTPIYTGTSVQLRVDA